jgi:hypothetical protein
MDGWLGGRMGGCIRGLIRSAGQHLHSTATSSSNKEQQLRSCTNPQTRIARKRRRPLRRAHGGQITDFRPGAQVVCAGTVPASGRQVGPGRHWVGSELAQLTPSLHKPRRGGASVTRMARMA